MSNVNVTRQGPEVQWDDTDRGDYIRLSQRDIDPPMRGRANGDVIRSWGLVLGAFALLMLLVLYGLAGWQCRPEANAFETSLACHASQGLFWLYLTGLVVAPLAGAATMLWSYRRRTLAETERALITRDAWSNPVHADVLRQMGPQWAAYQFRQRQAHEQVVAPYKVLPGGLENLSLHSSVTNRPDVAALPEPAAPGVDVGPLPVDRWLADLTDAYHVLLAAETGGGKSTTAKALLARRIEAGDDVLVVDPHFREGNWFELPGVGGGRNYREVEAALGVVLDEMNTRYEQYSRGARDFRRLTVLIDETPAIYQQLGDAWKQFARQLGSEARKVNISIVLLTQSPLVQDIGVNTSMQRNFRRVALDAATIRVMLERDELNRERREALAAMLAGREYPATVELNGQVWFLDRTGLDRVPAPANSADAAWADGYEAVRGSFVRSFESNTAQELLQELLRTNERTNERSREAKLDELRALRAAGITRERAREMGFAFTDADWTLAGR